MASASGANMAMVPLNFGLFIKPMGDELAIGRATFGWASSARQFATSATSPIVGRLLDRFGARLMLPIAAVLTGAAMVWLSFSHHAWQLVLIFALMGLAGMSGPGALMSSVPVMKWFVRNRGKAVAFMSLGIPIGALIFVPLTQVFIDWWTWRGALIALAVIGVGVVAPLTLIVVRRQPEDMGLRPDGAAPDNPAQSGTAHGPAEETSWTAKEAMRSGSFWRLVVVFSLVALGVGTLGVHRIPSFMDRGLDARLVSFATAFDAVCAGISVFTMGFLVRKFSPALLGAVGFLLLAIASVLTIYATSVTVMFISMAVFGLGIGGQMFLQNFMWADYFGRRHLGSIRGIVTPVTLIIGGIGAPLAGYIRDSTGSYTSIWWGGAALMLVGALALAMTSAPRKQRAAPGS